MLINIDLQANEPIYEQLKNQIMIRIARKELKPGDGLPSVRIFAADLGINLHTVNKAYQQLKQEGFILIHRQKGVVINPEIPSADGEYEEKLTRLLRPLIAESACRGMTEVEFTSFCRQLFHQLTEEGDEG
ncbi:GntR family transcriptional regulator [Sediminibacillus halophilus]|uniref:DNA-binding transcriptional regulator YhcF, GntR family n=1 Tax=Sediminibacillus halophilus TaxID=482461 RepID=A0A1G9X7Z6_9BACI|nr:GntR family transcriptional regulator [Sediminibacillus halophilus]SDM92767.1 DNA-binding transcriptional regulator YhcF, GntR family [Sediminibacillus halophilus]